MVDLVLSDVETFRGMAVQSDDITLVVGAHR
jgi:serine phosphatase RsbU (regulator of sigma subunit)